jgi:hypothetical protein
MHFVELEYLCEFEFIFKKALAPSSGSQNGCFNKKKPRVENLMKLSL